MQSGEGATIAAQDLTKQSSREIYRYRFLLGFGVIFLLAGGLPALFGLREAVREGDLLILVTLPLRVAGLFIAWKGWNKQADFWAVGKTALRIQPLSATDSKRLAADFDLPHRFTNAKLGAKLVCIRWEQSVFSGAMEGFAVWETSSPVRCSPADGGLRADICIYLPSGILEMENAE